MSHASHLGVLLERPHKWTTHHRDLLQVTEAEASSEEIVGSIYLPHDGDLEFEGLAADFAKPTREDFLDGTIHIEPKCTQSPFRSVYKHLASVIRQEEMGEELSRSDYISSSRRIVESLVNTLLGHVEKDTWFTIALRRELPFHIHSCSVKGVLKPVGMLSRCSEIEDRRVAIPAATDSVCSAINL